MSAPNHWAHFPKLVLVEFQKLTSRTIARIGLLAALAVGVAVPLLAFTFQWMTQQAGAAPQGPDATRILANTLYFRNFGLNQVFLITLTAMHFAGEWQARTLREDMVRAVPRTSIIMSKFLSLFLWNCTALLATFLSCAAFSVIIWGVSGPWLALLGGYAMTLVTDAGFIALILLCSVATRSVPGTFATMILLYFANLAIGAATWAISQSRQVAQMFGVPTWIPERVGEIRPYLPSAAFDSWQNTSALFYFVSEYQGWVWSSFISLMIILFGALLATERLFRRIDVP